MNKKGFTFIEVALVLGLAAIIFMMAFIALPSLWTSQRDADRKANVMTLVSNLKTYQTNNSRGALPVISSGGNTFSLQSARESDPKDTTWEYFIKNYVDKNFTDPLAGENYENVWFHIIKCGDDVKVNVGATCTDGVLNSVNTGIEPAFDRENFTFYIVTKSTCDGDHAVSTNSERSVSVIQVLERGGRYCHSTDRKSVV